MDDQTTGIDYEKFSSVTDTAVAELVRLYVVKFKRWVDREPSRKKKPTSRLFKQWWFLKGPTGFPTVQDALVFKAKLLQAINDNETTNRPDSSTG